MSITGTTRRRSHISRRRLLGASIKIGTTAIVLRSFSPNAARASGPLQTSEGVEISNLILALRATGKDVCLNAAAQLDALGMNASDFDLHLRSADLDHQDALNIAVAINGLRGSIGPSLRSFSISYNPEIGNAGAIALLGSLPASLIEIGMVGCDLGDESGEALLNLAPQAPALRMLCIEGNEFSALMRGRLSQLRNARSGLTVIV